MRMEQCSNCDKTTGHKRALGWGTLFAVILTAGLWLIAIPFYPTRCVACGAPGERQWAKNILLMLGIAMLLIFPLMILYVLTLDDSIVPMTIRN